MTLPNSQGPRTGGGAFDGVGLVGLSAQGRVERINASAALLLGGVPHEIVGQPLEHYFRDEGRLWIRRSLELGGLGIEERPARTIANIAVRMWQLRSGDWMVMEDSAHEAMDVERESHRCDDARAQMAAAVARDLNDPMSIVQGRLELLLELGGPESEPLQRHLKIALDHARRVSSTLHMLRLVGGPKNGDGSSTPAHRLLTAACQNVDGATLRIDMQPKNLALYGPPDLLEQVLVGLVGRVRDAASRGLQARAIGREEAGHAVLELRAELAGGGDPAPVAVPGDPRLDIGVPAQVLGRIGGRLEAFKLGRGLLYRMVLPLAPPWSPVPVAHRGTAIVVGLDSPTDLCALMAQEGFDATCVENGEMALATLESQQPDAVVSSMHLPGMSGLTLMRRACERWPRLKNRAVLVCRAPPAGVPPGVAVCTLPLDRLVLMRGLGVSGTGPRR